MRAGSGAPRSRSASATPPARTRTRSTSPPREIDFATVVVRNAPWATPADVAALTSGKLDRADVRYRLHEVDLGGYIKLLEDRAVNVFSSSETVRVTPPRPSEGGRARDLLVVATLSNGAGVTFDVNDDMVCLVSYVTEDADALAAEDGINVYSLTEIMPATADHRAMFLVARRTVAEFDPMTTPAEA
ncbi:MAG: hypothetical protein ACI4RA_05560 [Kiritimatiellia bacterium]